MLPASRDLSRAHDELVIEVRLKRRERLDLHLLRALGWRSRTRIQRLIASGRVTVNDGAVKASQRVCGGDRIRVALDGGGEERLPGAIALPAPFWEDPYLVAVDKPPGRLVHPVGRAVGGTIVNEIHHRYRALNERGRRPVIPKLCHRLDRDTSGVLLIAKLDFVRRRLQEAFEEDRVEKEYWAVVEGRLAVPSFEVLLPIRATLDRSRAAGNRLARVDCAGKPAHTLIEWIATGPGFSLVRCRPRTGRQNQIRAHLAAAGHPILGDVGFGSDAEHWCSGPGGSLPFPGRALLHSAALRFPHPVWGIARTLRRSPPADFAPYLAASDLSCGKPSRSP